MRARESSREMKKERWRERESDLKIQQERGEGEGEGQGDERSSMSSHSVLPPRGTPVSSSVLRSDLGSNISLLKTLNLRFRCFLARVHELERRNRLLEKQVSELSRSSLRKETSSQTDGAASCSLSTYPKYLSPRNRPILRTPRPTPSPPQVGVWVQADTVTPEVRALHAVLGKARRERDEYRRRWEEESALRVAVQDAVLVLQQEARDAELVQDDLRAKLERLRAELVVFRSLLNDDMSELDTKIQEQARRVDMDICRRIDITARLCDVARDSHRDIFQCFPVSPARCPRRPEGDEEGSADNESETLQGENVEVLAVSEADGNLRESKGDQASKQEDKSESTQASVSLPINAEGGTGSSTNGNITDEMKRLLSQLRESVDIDDESIGWESDDSLLLWDDFSGVPEVEGEASTEDEVERAISETETLLQSREQHYHETISQIELELRSAKSDMTRHLSEYMEMCSMKRGLDVQMETCKRLIGKPRPLLSPTSASEESSEVENNEEGNGRDEKVEEGKGEKHDSNEKN
uniref:intermediate filament family orphan 2-like isoform X3 n=1 Tax=Myxine glutinosa TaxID=7769 RepID=UPI00359018D4